MKSKRGNKLSLSAETVRRLNNLELGEVAAGATSHCTENPLVCGTSAQCTARAPS